MLLRHQRIKLIGLAIVILICYSLSAIFKERVLRRPYGEGEGERFKFAFALTAVQCVVFMAVAKAVITVRNHSKNETPQRYFCIIGVFYVLSKVTSYMSLRYVPYPTQVVGKSSKPIPIMILGVLIGRKTYTVYKYIFVFIIVAGVALFSFKEKYDKKDGEDPILGIIFIGVSLLMDGFLGAFEDRMRSVKKPTPLNLMLFMNSWNSLYLITYLVTTSEGIEFIKFCQRHPIVIRDLGVIVFVGIFGQFCITSMIANFGALPLSITTTIRKFVTVILSVIIFSNVLSIRQWIAASVIFIALFLDGYFSRKTKKGGKKKNEEEDIAKVENKVENGEILQNKNEVLDGVDCKIIENKTECEMPKDKLELEHCKKDKAVKFMEGSENHLENTPKLTEDSKIHHETLSEIEETPETIEENLNNFSDKEQNMANDSNKLNNDNTLSNTLKTVNNLSENSESKIPAELSQPSSFQDFTEIMNDKTDDTKL